jgi:hypothetical protein
MLLEFKGPEISPAAVAWSMRSRVRMKAGNLMVYV